MHEQSSADCIWYYNKLFYHSHEQGIISKLQYMSKNCVQFYTTGEIRDMNSNISVSCTVIMYSVHSVQFVDVNATQYMCRGVDSSVNMVRAAFPILIVISQHRTYKEAVPTTCNRWQAMFLCCTTTASHGNTTPVQLWYRKYPLRRLAGLGFADVKVRSLRSKGEATGWVAEMVYSCE